MSKNNLFDAISKVVPVANTFKLMLGISLETELDLSDSLSITEEESLITKKNNLANNTVMKQKELQILLAKEQTEIARASYYPTVNASGTYQYQSQEDDFDLAGYNWAKTRLCRANFAGSYL